MISEVKTKKEIKNLLTKSGLKESDTVMVHSSLSSLGYVVNGAEDVITELIEIINIKKGTIMMPSHTGQMTDPRGWVSPKIKKELINKIKKNMKCFDKKKTPIRNRGIIPLTFFNQYNVSRSPHPLNSVIALGKNQKIITKNHDFHDPEGINSPLGELYKRGGKIVLIGVGLDRCSGIHLAESIANVPYLGETKVKCLRNAKNMKKKFKTIKKYPNGSEYFVKIERELIEKKIMKKVEGIISLIEFEPMIKFILTLLQKDPYYLTKE